MSCGEICHELNGAVSVGQISVYMHLEKNANTCLCI
jgi:hypothetical protein